MLAVTLSRENHDITIIDNDIGVIRQIGDLDVLPIEGNALTFEVLIEAEIKHADIFISTMRSDESNMLACIIAKKLGAGYTIARIRDPQYLHSMGFITQELQINFIANPERATAREISRMLRLPFTSGVVETFARGLVEMVEMHVTGDEIFANIPLSEVFKSKKSMLRVLFCGVKRGDEAIIPKGDFIIREGDIVYITADYATITSYFRLLGKNGKAARDAMIVGGSRIAYYLAETLTESGVNTKIIELDPEKARRLDELLSSTNVICGDGTNQELLLSEGLKTTDSFIALTDRDEENIMAGMYATHTTKGKVIVKNNRTTYLGLLNEMGLDTIINPSQIACNIILKAVRAHIAGEGRGVERMYKIMGGCAEALEFIVPEDAPYLSRPLSDLHVDDDSIVAVIVRGNRVTVPFGLDTIEKGDHVVVITKRTGIVSLGDILKVK